MKCKNCKNPNLKKVFKIGKQPISSVFHNKPRYKLKNYSLDDGDSLICSNNPSSCCDKPSQYEIDMDWNLLSESLDFEYGLDLNEGSNLNLPNCCKD